MKDAINANMNESKRISHFTQLLFFQPPVDAEQMLEVFFGELLPQPPNAQDKEETAKMRKQIVLRKLEYYLSKFESIC